MPTYRIHYMKPDFFRDGMIGRKPDIAKLSDTHAYLRTVEAVSLDQVYTFSQGEVWSPNGEARDLIRSKDLRHTSMSVGDVIEDQDGEFFVVASFGFDRLGSMF